MARLAGAKVGRKIGLTAGAVAGRKAGAKACILAVDTAIQEVSRDKVAALRVLFAEIAFKAGMFDSISLKNNMLQFACNSGIYGYIRGYLHILYIFF